MITPREKNILRNLVVSDSWTVVKKIAQDYINDARLRSKRKSSEWDTLQAVIGDDAEITGIVAFISLIDKYAREST